jgi:hypothetical protein
MLRLLIAPLAEQVIVGIASGETAFFCSKFEGFLAVELGLADKFIHAIGERLGGVARDSGLTGKGRPNKKRDFAPYRFFFERIRELRKSDTAKLFMEFSDFAREACRAVAENIECVRDGFGDAVRSFVQDEGAIFNAKAFESTLTFARTGGEKANKKELFVGQTRSGESCEQGGRTRYRNDGNLVPSTEGDEAITGIADERHTGVRDKRDFGALLHGEDEFGGAGHFVMLMIGDEGFLNLVMREKLLGVTGVFASDLVGFFENAKGAEGNVLKIADGRADEVEAAARILR